MVVLLFAASPGFAGQTNADFTAIAFRVQGWVDQGYYPGAALLVAKDNRVVYEKCFGGYTPDTEVLIASAGKWLAAAAIMSLVDEGKLSLEDHPSKFLPEFKGDTKDQATLRQMLSHTSGYPPYQPKENPVDKYQTLAESVAHLVPLPLDFQPGERFDYGGLAMQVAGRMAEVASGKDWETLFQERIAKPCRMVNTHFTPVDQGGGHSPMLGGGARSSLRGYANFLSMIFNDGKFEGKRVLSKKAIREMQANQIRGASVKQPEFPARVRGTTHAAIYGLGEWREELDARGHATLISSPSWAGAYPWIDKTTGVYGVMLAHIDAARPNPEKFSGFYSSPVLAQLVRETVTSGMERGVHVASTSNFNTASKSTPTATGNRALKRAEARAPFAPADAVWQWSAEITSINDSTTNHPRAFLWIPGDCKKIRAVVFAQNNMIEEGILQHPKFRAELAKLGIAEIFVAPFFDYWQVATNNDATNEKFSKLLKTFASESGYGELEFVPVIPLGHSASASMPWNFAAWNPERTLAVLSVHGDAPQTTLTGNGRPNLDWGARNIDGIPALMVMGEYEWMDERLAPALKFRAAHPTSPIAALAEPGRGHFDYSDDLVKFLALFIRKSAEQRLKRMDGFLDGWMSGAGTNNPIIQKSNHPILRSVDPRAGWLVEHWHLNQPRTIPPAPFAKFTGDKNDALWAFDKETALAMQNYRANQIGKAPQLLGFMQNGKILPQTATHNQINLKFQPDADGLTFHLKATNLDFVDGGSPNTTRWTGLPAGSPIGHVTEGSIKISRISGPVEQISADTFAVSLNRSALPFDRRAGDLWLLAEHPGDKKFKSAVQQALLKIPIRLNEGAEQHITFPEIADVKSSVIKIKLAASSDAGVPVKFFVREGPAEIFGDELRLTKIPPRAKFPVKVTVVAWQYGRSIEPKLKSAAPVERTFFITK